MEFLGQGKSINQVNPLVSVCVPTFNHAKFIRSCLESILIQETDFPFEILIGEDDSTDGTREICLELAQNHQDKIRLFLRKKEDKIFLFGRKSGRGNHLGLYGSSRGKYVCICDGDDLWTDPLKLQKQVDAMEKYTSASMCITNSYLEMNPGQNPPGVPDQFKVFNRKSINKVFYMGHISSWMLRNEMSELLSNEIVKKPIPLDKVIFSFYKKKGDIVYLPEITTTYRYNPNGIYLSQSKKKNHRALFRHNWYLFRFIHKDPMLFLRSIIYNLGRFFVNFN
ncbi:MAG: glycosyltransferase [Algoriphagus sp.]|uniref:glycosyltransferase family 2 protein n=1 Tax=Algoriphagus sp. TaxID=1872435 RepID=UPI0026285B5A|nr:glycosyltransferase [Algoriphagus sp.]MDG1276907.1 glycosyltransferase [Algoriphagus sp.]